jgi:hypothetical protein
LQDKKKIANASLNGLVKAENEEKLNSVYQEIQNNSELYQSKTKKVIDYHELRVRAAIKIENKSPSTDYEKQLAAKLRTIINSDSNKNTLEELQKELNELKSTSEKKKKAVYDNHCKAINLMLEEIKEEMLRREQSKKAREKISDNKKVSPTNKKLTIPLVVIMAGISIFLIIFFLYLVSRHRKKIRAKKETNK